VIRGFFGRMDVPARQSYMMAVVGPQERSAMAGLNSVSRSVSGTVSPSVATVLWSIGAASIPFISCGVMKIAYDVSLYFMFRKVRPPEEVR
jgi:sugar phosphate permease